MSVRDRERTFFNVIKVNIKLHLEHTTRAIHTKREARTEYHPLQVYINICFYAPHWKATRDADLVSHHPKSVVPKKNTSKTIYPNIKFRQTHTHTQIPCPSLGASLTQSIFHWWLFLARHPQTTTCVYLFAIQSAAPALPHYMLAVFVS